MYLSHEDNEHPTESQELISDFTEDEGDGPVSFQGLRDLLDALMPSIEARATAMVRLYSNELAHALDEMGAVE